MPIITRPGGLSGKPASYNGDEAEVLAEFTLKSMGARETYRAPRSRLQVSPGVTAAYGNDLFGLFDVCAIFSDRVWFVQVKGTRRRTPPNPAWRERVQLLPPNAATYQHWWLDQSRYWHCWLFNSTEQSWKEVVRTINGR